MVVSHMSRGDQRKVECNDQRVQTAGRLMRVDRKDPTIYKCCITSATSVDGKWLSIYSIYHFEHSEMNWGPPKLERTTLRSIEVVPTSLLKPVFGVAP